MPRLNNPTDIDLFAPQIHRSVLAFRSIDITDDEAALFQNNSIFTIGSNDEDDETPRVKRQYTKRGSQVAEVDSAPAMETRG